ncbi:MAG: xanthine dehydrogenase family protein molybdopterin-binding subunit [Rubrobacteraceae bacterium]
MSQSVGKSIRRNDVEEKVRGTARYGGDLAGPGTLVAKVLRSEYPHAIVRGANVAGARSLPGVIAIYTPEDVPGTNTHGLVRRDQAVLAGDKVRYRGDAVALVVAENARVAEKALGMIEVDYEPLPAAFTIEEALDPEAPHIHPEGSVMGVSKLRKGDAERAFREEAEVVVEGEWRTQVLDHAFLDLEAGMAEYDGDVLTIHVSGQWVHEERRLTALALGLPVEKVRIVQPVTGGAFGGREDLSIQVFLGLAALKLGQSVRLDYSRAESMIARHKRHPIRLRYKLGAQRDGTLVAAQVEAHADTGSYASTGFPVLRKVASHCTGPYRVPNVRADATGVFTNNNPSGAMRGFGATQTSFAYEGAMDMLADKLDMDRVELRRKNLIESGEAVTTGQIVPVASGLQCLEEAQRRIGWDERDYETGDPNKKRGYGVSTICFGISYGDAFWDASRAKVRFAADDVLELYTGAVEVGQGLVTAMAQISAEELGVDPATVRVNLADTHTTQEAGSTSASRQTYFTGSAVRLAAFELKRQLLDVAATLMPLHPDEMRFEDCYLVSDSGSVPLDEVLAEARRRGCSLEGFGIFQPSTISGDPETGLSPHVFATYLFASHAARVLVDVGTGEVEVEKVVAVHDVGRAINPQLVTGQIEGGVAMGLGMALMEEIVREDGEILNPNFTDYLLPTTLDVPEIEAVFLENLDPGGPYGARDVGEPPLIGTPAAILGAISDAIGTRITELPATPERVWRAARTNG